MSGPRVQGCTGKRRYATRELALEVNAGIRAKHRKASVMHPYQCGNCGCWHVSHLTAEEHKAKLERLRTLRAEWARR